MTNILGPTGPSFWEEDNVVEKIYSIYKVKYGDDAKMIPIAIIQNLINAGKALKLNIGNEIMIAKNEDDKTFYVQIMRGGYMSVAQNDPSYIIHTSNSFYSKDKLLIDDGKVVQEKMPGDRGKLEGAWATIKLEGKPQICTTVVYSDYKDKGYWWNEISGMPDFMIQKQAEIAIIKKAFGKKLSGVHFEEEMVSRNIEDEEENLRAYIQSYSDNELVLGLLDGKEGLQHMKSARLKEIIREINKIQTGAKNNEKK